MSGGKGHATIPRLPRCDGLLCKAIVAGEDREAAALCEKVLQSNPGDAAAANNLALLLANGTDRSLWAPARAVQLAQQAVRQMPKNPGRQATLGIAYYRLGDWKAAQG